ncbi:MAG: TrkA family potassium uptake protein [Clostridiales bacterium]|nr:TrkA family potassium uptake protein [Clostridiales bacterium]
MLEKNQYTIIAGCGRLGAGIGGKLSERKQDVCVIDKDKTAFRKLPGFYGGLTLVCNATDLDKLKSVEIEKANTFLAVTDDDSVNICAAQIAKKIFNVPKVVARIYDRDKIPLLKKMDIDTICPTELSEKEIEGYIQMGGENHVEEK